MPTTTLRSWSFHAEKAPLILYHDAACSLSLALLRRQQNRRCREHHAQRHVVADAESALPGRRRRSHRQLGAEAQGRAVTPSADGRCDDFRPRRAPKMHHGHTGAGSSAIRRRRSWPSYTCCLQDFRGPAHGRAHAAAH